MSRLALVAVQEALEVCDYRLAAAIVNDALEGDAPRIERTQCRFCGRGFVWPGLLDEHQLFCVAESAA